MHLCTQNDKCLVQKYAIWHTPSVFLIIVASQIIETHYSTFIRYFTYKCLEDGHKRGIVSDCSEALCGNLAEALSTAALHFPGCAVTGYF